jgi:protein-S-isoprenylcysteine O-methyltransferase
MSSNGNANVNAKQATNGHGNSAPIEPVSLLPEAKQYNLRGGLPNSPLSVSVISALLGALFGSCLALALVPAVREVGWGWARPQLGVYLACMGLFHLCEFWTTAGWNPQKLTVDGESSRCHRMS